MKTLKENILKLVQKKDFVSFVELGDLDGFKGEFEMALDNQKHNVVFWAGISEQGVKALTELQDEKQIRKEPCEWITYLVDGAIPNMPIKKSGRPNKKPMWLPIAWRPYSK